MAVAHSKSSSDHSRIKYRGGRVRTGSKSRMHGARIQREHVRHVTPQILWGGILLCCLVRKSFVTSYIERAVAQEVPTFMDHGLTLSGTLHGTNGTVHRTQFKVDRGTVNCFHGPKATLDAAIFVIRTSSDSPTVDLHNYASVGTPVCVLPHTIDVSSLPPVLQDLLRAARAVLVMVEDGVRHKVTVGYQGACRIRAANSDIVFGVTRRTRSPLVDEGTVLSELVEQLVCHAHSSDVVFLHNFSNYATEGVVRSLEPLSERAPFGVRHYIVTGPKIIDGTTAMMMVGGFTCVTAIFLYAVSRQCEQMHLSTCELFVVLVTFVIGHLAKGRIIYFSLAVALASQAVFGGNDLLGALGLISIVSPLTFHAALGTSSATDFWTVWESVLVTCFIYSLAYVPTYLAFTSRVKKSNADSE